ncbi:probable peptidoglycan-associated lipoprotein precursor [Erythrobacter sp. NAP1]|nr:probable peptidoglycan-associated lipoprotein precursor [Erythrobacter sp. NAP1]
MGTYSALIAFYPHQLTRLNLTGALCRPVQRQEITDMTFSISKAATVALMTSALALGACSKKAPEELPPAPVSTPTPAPAPAPTAPTGPVPGTQGHFEAAVGSSSVIYFDTDRFNIDSTDAAALQAQAQYFARFPQLTFTIEGHCDERGTREYNLALGERRANAAKNYLVSLGVSPNRIRTVSYGKERPVALASTPAAWSQNRRAASIIIN